MHGVTLGTLCLRNHLRQSNEALVVHTRPTGLPTQPVRPVLVQPFLRQSRQKFLLKLEIARKRIEIDTKCRIICQVLEVWYVGATLKCGHLRSG